MSRFMGHWRNYFAAATDAPYAFGEAAGLMALSALSLGHRELKVGRGISPNLFMLLVGDSTVARKSTCVRFTRWLLDAVAPHLIGPSDYTMEGLYKWMQRIDPDTQQKQQRLCLINEEFGQVMSRAGANGYNANFRGDMCSLYDGEDITKTRSGAAHIDVKRPRVSMFGGASYGFLGQTCSKDDWLSGFMVRFLFVAPAGMRPTFANYPEDPATEFALAVQTLSSIYAEMKHTTGTALPFSKPAATAIADFVNGRMEKVMEEAVTEQEKTIGPTYVQRYSLNIRKLALLYQIDRDPHAEVGVGAVLDAIGYSNSALWDSYGRTYEATTASDYETALRWVLQRANRPGGVSRREVFGRFMSKPGLPNMLVGYLVSAGAYERFTDNGGNEAWRATDL